MFYQNFVIRNRLPNFRQYSVVLTSCDSVDNMRIIGLPNLIFKSLKITYQLLDSLLSVYRCILILTKFYVNMKTLNIYLQPLNLFIEYSYSIFIRDICKIAWLMGITTFLFKNRRTATLG